VFLDSAWKTLELCSPLFECACSLLLDQLQDELTWPQEMLTNMLQVVGVANRSVLEVSIYIHFTCIHGTCIKGVCVCARVCMQDNVNAVTNLLSGLLHWCLFDRSK